MAHLSSMTFLSRSLLGGLAIALVLSAAPAPLAAGQASAADKAQAPVQNPGQNEIRYARAGTEGARVLNIPDVKGFPIKYMAAGSLLRVYSVSAGFAEVEVPGGLEVWVYGRYLNPIGTAGSNGLTELMEVVGDGVNMRPRPEATTGHFPLGQRLERGQRVRVIERSDPKRPAKEDWFHIFSPTGMRGWVSATNITVAGEPKAATWEAEWAAADTVNVVTVPAAGTPGMAKHVAAESDPVIEAMAAAEALWSTARAQDNTGTAAPDWSAVGAAYGTVLALDAESGAGRLATERMRWIDARQEMARLQLELLQEQERRMSEAEELREMMRLASLARDPLWGRFRSRGWLERVEDAGGNDHWRLIWGGSAVAEVTCSSGRYPLALYADYEVGVMGATLAPATPGAPALIDVTRIEVISRRYR
jgi:hypothetical protein